MSYPIEPERRREVAALIAAAPSLSPAEIRVCLLLLDGRTTSEIAGALGVSERTVQNQRYSIRRKMGVRENLTVALLRIVL